jgi:hypothetical protein
MARRSSRTCRPRRVGFAPDNGRWGGTSKSAFGCMEAFARSTTETPPEVFTVDEVNDLMEQLIERQRDGAKLVLVR